MDEPVDGPLTVTTYPGADGAFALYEDDGRTFAYREGAWTGIAMAWNEASRRLAIRLVPGWRNMPSKRPIDVRVAGTSTARRVVFDGAPLEVRLQGGP